jgi:hypothetical protein
VVAQCPVTDMRRVAPLQDAVLGGAAADHEAAVRAGSPTDLVRPDLPPTLLVLGSADHFVFPDLSTPTTARCGPRACPAG